MNTLQTIIYYMIIRKNKQSKDNKKNDKSNLR